jgi:1-aminocyclopropane-1-carboxylate deaminase/D-cysteine desulfhydrase-like pyridoxal-dependent ACC family enzyme
VNTILELISQAVDMDINIDYLVHTAGSGGTQAGLVIGAKLFNTGIKVIASTSGSRPRDVQIEKVSNLIAESLEFLELDLKISEDEIIVYDQYAGGGYGFMTKDKAEVFKIVAET